MDEAIIDQCITENLLNETAKKELIERDRTYGKRYICWSYCVIGCIIGCIILVLAFLFYQLAISSSDPSVIILAKEAPLFSISLRISILIVSFLLIHALGNIYRYLTRMSNHFFARSNALLMLGKCDDLEKLEKLVSLFNQDSIAFDKIHLPQSSINKLASTK